MLLYPIRAVSKLTGISADTLRAWERRHQAVTPQRDSRGRLYTEVDVERLRLLNSAVERGHAIGRLVGLSDDELRDLVAGSGQAVSERSSAKANHEPDSVSPGLIAAIRRLDYASAEHEMGLLTAVMTPRDFVHNVALPLMKYVGDNWHGGLLDIAHEHMTSAVLRNLLGALIPRYRRETMSGRLLLATPSGEYHEFGILLSATLAVGAGLGVVYLGPNLPGEEIVAAAEKTAPHAVVVGFVGANGAQAGLRDLQLIAERLPARIELWVGGTRNPQLVNEIRQTRALLIEDFDVLEQHLTRLGGRF